MPRKASEAVHATIHLLPAFKPGDRLDGNLAPAVLELLLERGEASYEAPGAPAAEPEPEAPAAEPAAAE